MADELDLDLSPTPEEEHINKVEKRIKDLSEKVKLTSTERDDLAKAKDESEAKATAALKDVDFYKNFSAVSSKYAGANEYQDKIREKVNSGYTLEDATVSVLNSEGKFVPTAQAPRESPAGGSAVNTFNSGGEKTVGDMTQAERRAALMEAEKRGDLGLT